MSKVLLVISFLFILFQGASQINSTYKWTWIGGDKVANSFGVYGQKGVESATNKPGARGFFYSWMDFNGNLWIFGGHGMGASGQGNLNDLWRYNLSTNRWTWMAGDSLPNRPAFQSGIGVEATKNTPSSRESGTFWDSGDGRELYLFGGFSTYAGYVFYGDVWAYNVVSEKWRIVKFAIVDSAGNCRGQTWKEPDEFFGGTWPVCRLGATAANDGGKAYVFGGSAPNAFFNDFYMFSDYNHYHPNNNQWASIDFPLVFNQPGKYRTGDPSPGSRTVSSSFTYNNKFYLFGGTGYGAMKNGVSPLGKLNDLWRYDGRDILTKKPTWTWLGGDTTVNNAGEYGIKGTGSSINKPKGREHGIMKHADGSQYILFAGGSANGDLNDLWSYDAHLNVWTWLSGSSGTNDGGTYGVQGTQTATNMISARAGTAMWILPGGDIYVFGGSTPWGKKNDMWKFSPQDEADPVNDAPCGAVELTLNARPSYGNTAFATSTNDIAGNCYGATNTVWYKYTPAVSGLVQFTLGAGLSGDTLNSWVGVFVPTSINCPSGIAMSDSTITTFKTCKFYNASTRKTPTVWSPYLTAGRTYYFRISGINGDIGKYAFSLQAINPIVPASPNITKIANRELTDGLGWTHYLNDNGTADPNDDTRLVSIKKNGNNIGEIGDGTFQMKVVATNRAGSGHAVSVNSPLIPQASKFYSMNRYWNVIPTHQLVTPVDVRFYFNIEDVYDVEGDLPANSFSIANLKMYKLDGGNPDPESGWQGGTAIRYYEFSNNPEYVPAATHYLYSNLGNNIHQAQFQVNHFSGGGAGATSMTTLPVTVAKFEVAAEKDKVRVNWSTATELNSKNFEVQRSIDGFNFQSVTKVSASGNSSILRNYSFDDKEAVRFVGTTLYYRLAIVDMNGQQTFTEIKSIRIENRKDILTLQFNPAQGEAVVNYVSSTAGRVNIRIIDEAGRSILVKPVLVKKGTNRINLQTTGLAKGIYAITVYSNDRSSVTKQFQKL